MENMMQYVIKNQKEWGTFLFYFGRKCAKQAFSLFIAVVGTYMGLQFDEAGFFNLDLDFGGVFLSGRFFDF